MPDLQKSIANFVQRYAMHVHRNALCLEMIIVKNVHRSAEIAHRNVSICQACKILKIKKIGFRTGFFNLFILACAFYGIISGTMMNSNPEIPTPIRLSGS